MFHVLLFLKTDHYQSFVQKGIGLKYKPLKSGGIS